MLEPSASQASSVPRAERPPAMRRVTIAAPGSIRPRRARKRVAGLLVLPASSVPRGRRARPTPTARRAARAATLLRRHRPPAQGQSARQAKRVRPGRPHPRRRRAQTVRRGATLLPLGRRLVLESSAPLAKPGRRHKRPAVLPLAQIAAAACIPPQEASKHAVVLRVPRVTAGSRVKRRAGPHLARPALRVGTPRNRARQPAQAPSARREVLDPLARRRAAPPPVAPAAVGNTLPRVVSKRALAPPAPRGPQARRARHLARRRAAPTALLGGTWIKRGSPGRRPPPARRARKAGSDPNSRQRASKRALCVAPESMERLRGALRRHPRVPTAAWARSGSTRA